MSAPSSNSDVVVTPRNLDVERTRTAEAGALVARDVGPLIVFAESRAVGPIRDLRTRDFGLEALEELGDCRNYLEWLPEQLIALGTFDLETAEAIANALSHVVVAFDEVNIIREKALAR